MCVLGEVEGGSKSDTSSQAICDIIFLYLFNYGLFLVYLFYECDKLDVLF